MGWLRPFPLIKKWLTTHLQMGYIPTCSGARNEKLAGTQLKRKTVFGRLVHAEPQGLPACTSNFGGFSGLDGLFALKVPVMGIQRARNSHSGSLAQYRIKTRHVGIACGKRIVNGRARTSVAIQQVTQVGYSFCLNPFPGIGERGKKGVWGVAGLCLVRVLACSS